MAAWLPHRITSTGVASAACSSSWPSLAIGCTAAALAGAPQFRTSSASAQPAERHVRAGPEPQAAGASAPGASAEPDDRLRRAQRPPASRRPCSCPPGTTAAASRSRSSSPRTAAARRGRSNATFWGRMPTRGRFAVVNPDGTGRRMKGAFSYGYAGHIDDLARMPQILERKLPWVRIDRERIYALGSSMGGQETLLLVARHPGLLAGAAAMDSVTDLGRRFHQLLDVPSTPKFAERWGAPVGKCLQSSMQREVGGTPDADALAYARRSPLALARRIARSGVALQIWWSRKDTIVFDQEHQSQALVEKLKELGTEAPLIAYSGDWAHSKEMHADALLALALQDFGLLPRGFKRVPPNVRRVGSPRRLRSSRRRARPGRARPSGRSSRSPGRSARAVGRRRARRRAAGRPGGAAAARAPPAARRAGTSIVASHRPLAGLRARTRPGRSSSACRAPRSAARARASRAASRTRAAGRTARPAASRGSWTSSSRSFVRNAPLLAAFGGRYVTRWQRAAHRLDAGRLAADERSGRHRDRELAVEAQHELVGLVVVGEEARGVDPVHLVRPAGGEARLLVERVGAGAHEPEQARAVQPHVPEDALRLRAPGTEETGRERVRRDEVPVAAETRLGHRPVRLLAGEQRHRDEQGAVREPALRPRDGSAQARARGACATPRARVDAARSPMSAQTPAIARSPCHTTACVCSP